MTKLMEQYKKSKTILIILETTIIGITIWFWENVGYIWLICMHSVYVPLLIPLLMDSDVKSKIFINFRKYFLFIIYLFLFWWSIILTVYSWPEKTYQFLSAISKQEIKKSVFERQKWAGVLNFFVSVLNQQLLYWLIIIFCSYILISEAKKILKQNKIDNPSNAENK